MTAIEALRAAQAMGVEITLDGDNLVLEASSPPSTAVLDALSRNKTEIVALLRPDDHGWSAEDWQVFFDERAGIAEFDGGQSREEAETMAFECCVIEWLDQHPCRSDPGRCAACGEPDREGDAVVPFGTESHGHTWLHPECWKEWNRKRQERAWRALAAMGLPVPQRHPGGFQHVE